MKSDFNPISKVSYSSVKVAFEHGNGKFSMLREARLVQPRNDGYSGWAPGRGVYFWDRVSLSVPACGLHFKGALAQEHKQLHKIDPLV